MGAGVHGRHWREVREGRIWCKYIFARKEYYAKNMLKLELYFDSWIKWQWAGTAMVTDSYEDPVFEIFGRGIKNTRVMKLKKTIFTSFTFVLIWKNLINTNNWRITKVFSLKINITIVSKIWHKQLILPNIQFKLKFYSHFKMTSGIFFSVNLSLKFW